MRVSLSVAEEVASVDDVPFAPLVDDPFEGVGEWLGEPVAWIDSTLCARCFNVPL